MKKILALSWFVAAFALVGQGQGDAIVGGRVIDASSNAPIAHARVSLTPTGRSARTTSVFTDHDGGFVFTLVPAGRYEIDATATGYFDGALGRYFPDDHVTILTVQAGERSMSNRLQLWKLSVVSGVVTDDRGEPTVNVQVQAFRQVPVASGTLWSWSESERTDDYGRYRLSRLSPGVFVVAVPGSGAKGSGSFDVRTVYYPSALSVDQAELVALRPGDERASVNVSLPPPARTYSVTGTVADGISGAGSFTVRLSPSEMNATTRLDVKEVPAASGAFRFDGILPGSYRLSVATVPSGAQVLGPGMVRAGVIRGVDTLPPTPATPTLCGEVVVVVGNADVTGVTIALSEGARISGRVKMDGELGTPSVTGSTQAGIIVQPADGREIGAVPLARIEADGSFRSVGLPPGLYEVAPMTAYGPLHGWSLASLLVAGREVAGRPVELARTDLTGVVMTVTDRITQIAGTVRDQQGRPRARVKVLIFAKDPALRYRLTWSPARVASSLSNDDGTYRLTGLLPGDYLATALTAESEPWSVPASFDALAGSAMSVTVQAGQTQNLDLRILR